MISSPPRFQFLGQKGQVFLTNIADANNLAAVLDEKVMDQLIAQCRSAKAEAAKAGVPMNATLELCSTLDSILKAFSHIRNEYYDRIDIERERAEAEDKLQEAIGDIQRSQSSQ